MAKFAIGPIGLALNLFTLQFKNATMVIWGGTQPSTPEVTVTGGNTTLATFTFAATPFATYVNSSGYNVQSANFVSSTVTPTNTGTATFARISFVIVSSNGGAWTTSTAYTVGDIVTSNTSYWMCISAGTSGATAPTGTNVTSFKDGGSTWAWIQPTASGQVIGDFSVGTTSAFDVQVTSTSFLTSVNQTITQFQLQTPAL